MNPKPDPEPLGGIRPFARWIRHGSIRIEDPALDSRLDRYLAERFRYRSRTQWVAMIEARRILVNGEAARPSRRLRLGDRIDYRPPVRGPEPAVDFAIATLFEDEWILAVDKPANLPVHPSGRYFRNTLLCELIDRRGETLDTTVLRIVHRLDRETSGVVIFAKNRGSAARLGGQFEDRRARKEYLLLVHGVPSADSFSVDAPLGPSTSSRVRKAVAVVPPGRGVEAQTEFVVLARGPAHSLLRARPRTGRLHQIRVHARHAGYPVVGDKLYGLDEQFFLDLAAGRPLGDVDRARLVLERQGLHAHRLTVTHPETLATVTFVSPLPRALGDACGLLGIPLPGEL